MAPYDELRAKLKERIRLAAEAEQKRLAAEAEQKRLAEEAEQKRLAEEALKLQAQRKLSVLNNHKRVGAQGYDKFRHLTIKTEDLSTPRLPITWNEVPTHVSDFKFGPRSFAGSNIDEEEDRPDFLLERQQDFKLQLFLWRQQHDKLRLIFNAWCALRASSCTKSKMRKV
jgi:hypothetical protein